MNSNRAYTKQQSFPLKNKIQRNSQKNNKCGCKALEIDCLNDKVKSLQIALAVATDENDQLRNQVSLLEATLDFAKTESQQKEETIMRLRAIIAKTQLIEPSKSPVSKRKKSI